MGSYLIDSNVISNYFAGIFEEKATQFIGNVLDKVPNLSVITVIEALCWRIADKSKENIVKAFVEEANILYIDHNIASQCVAIRLSKKIKLPDAVIAATAMVHRMTLLTSDHDFHQIPSLSIMDPYAL